MRWDDLFADLEAELAAAAAAEQQAEVAERTRIELSQVAWVDRLAATRRRVRLELLGGGAAEGVVAAVGDGWVVLSSSGRAAGATVTLVHLTAATSAQGLSRAAWAAPGTDVARRLTFAAALRRVARDRSAVALALVDGRTVVGTVDAVGADHLDLAEHPPDVPRRSSDVSRVVSVPLRAVASVSPVGESSWA